MSTLFETGIRPLIDKHIQEESEKVRDYGEYWSASSAGYCMRLVIMRRLKIPPVPEIADDKARTQRVFSSGHIFHEWIQGLTKSSGLSIAQELELQDDKLKIRGHVDDIVMLDDKPVLYDYKTANSQSFNYKKDNIGRYHKMQLATYMYMLRQPPGQPVDEARRLSISKDDLRMAEVQLMWSPELEVEVINYWTTLNDYWSKFLLPECTCLDHDGGFMGKRSAKGKVYNDYFWQGEPCSGEWYEQHIGKDKESK